MASYDYHRFFVALLTSILTYYPCCICESHCILEGLGDGARPRGLRLRAWAAVKIRNRQAVGLARATVCMRIFVRAAAP